MQVWLLTAGHCCCLYSALLSCWHSLSSCHLVSLSLPHLSPSGHGMLCAIGPALHLHLLFFSPMSCGTLGPVCTCHILQQLAGTLSICYSHPLFFVLLTPLQHVSPCTTHTHKNGQITVGYVCLSVCLSACLSVCLSRYHRSTNQ